MARICYQQRSADQALKRYADRIRQHVGTNIAWSRVRLCEWSRVMRRTPSIVPSTVDHTIYLADDDLGDLVQINGTSRNRPSESARFHPLPITPRVSHALFSRRPSIKPAHP